jgi:hypothetical protein
VVAAFFARNADRPRAFAKIVKQPSAFLPIAMSLLALSVVLVTLTIFGVPHDTDEGAVAHTWQLLMAGQVPLLIFFAVKWLPRAPRETLKIIIQSIFQRLLRDRRLMVTIRGAGHFGFSDPVKSPPLLGVMAALGKRMDGRRQIAITTDFLHAFFDTYLKGAPETSLSCGGYQEVDCIR